MNICNFCSLQVQKEGGRVVGGCGVRGVDFGLGIGYNTEPSSNQSARASVETQSRSAAVKSLKSGMMAQFRSSFVAASSSAANQSSQGTSLSGFVSGGTIGGERAAGTGTSNTVSGSSYQGANASAGNVSNLREDSKQSNSSSSASGRERNRERRRASGWDR